MPSEESLKELKYFILSKRRLKKNMCISQIRRCVSKGERGG